MGKHKKIIWIGVIMVLLVLTAALLFAVKSGILGNRIEYKVNTIPLYLNNNLYISDKPVLEIAGEMCVPVSALEECDAQEAVQELESYHIKEESYIPIDKIDDLSAFHVYKNDDAVYIDNFADQFDYSWTQYPYVSHAFGAIGNDTYTNSLEAFQKNYEAGHRVFEVDFTLTADSKLVAFHDWTEYTVITVAGFDLPQEKIGEPLTKEEFLNQKVKGKYTTLSFEDVAELMKEYPDIYIVTDTKETLEPYITQQFQYMVDAANRIDPEILDRIIPQIYGEEMYHTIMGIHKWNSIIYTMYNQGVGFSPQSVIDFTYANGIKVVTTYAARAHDLFINELKKRGIIIYMHTYNTDEEVAYWTERGADGFYTDFLLPGH